MNRAMIFIDGTWLYRNQRTLQQEFGDEYEIDYGKLPSVLSKIVAGQLRQEALEVVRTYFYCSIPVNFAPADQEAVDKQDDFYNLLREEFHYEVEDYPINFHGRRLK